MQTNLAYRPEKTNKPIIPWDYLTKEISKTFRFTNKENQEFTNSITAKLIAAIPFVADCYEPEKTAIAHLGLYVMEKRGFQKFCAHLPTDDIYILHRLDFISTFSGGNTKIIEHGMYLLALIMLEGYNTSVKQDTIKNIYNPIANGRWNYKQKKENILKILQKYKCPELDSLLTDPYPKW